MKRFTSIRDVDCVADLIKSALDFSHDPHRAVDLGSRKCLGLVFLNPSLRTRMSTHRAATLLGMDVMVLNAGADAWSIETSDGVIMDGKASEHIREAAAVMGQYCDILGIRTFPDLVNRNYDYSEHVLEQFIRFCRVPVISLESAIRHPLQSLADIITIEQSKLVPRPRIVLTWAPHPRALPQAVPNSLLEWLSTIDADVTVAYPIGYDLAPEFMKGISATHDQNEALQGADIVYAKNWSSWAQYGQILSTDPSWQITKDKMSQTNGARFMHCLPVRRNVIVSDSVLDSPASLVVKQAANRIPAAQAVLAAMLRAI